jgi:hypothetical protein
LVAQRATAKEKPAKFAVEAAEAAPHIVRFCRFQGFPEMFPKFVAGRLDESQPPIPSSKLALQIDLYSPAIADYETLPIRLDERTTPTWGWR